MSVYRFSQLFSLFPIQQTLPVDLSSSSVRSGGNGGASFHGSTSAFDPCCPGSTSRPPPYVSQAIPGPSQPAVVDSFSSSVVAQPQPQTQPQPCRHYMHPSCEYYGDMQNSNGAFSHFLLCVSKALMVFFTPIPSPTDGSLARSLHHQPSSACPHSHGNPQLTSQPPAQGDYVIPHTVTFHPSLPSHPSGHTMTPAPPPPLSTHHLSGSGAALAQHLPTEHQTLPHHIPALGASVQRLHQHEMLQRMEVQRRRLMQHPT